MPTGYVGQMLELDLTTRKSRTIPLTQDVTDRWIGGTGWERTCCTSTAHIGPIPSDPTTSSFSPQPVSRHQRPALQPLRRVRSLATHRCLRRSRVRRALGGGSQAIRLRCADLTGRRQRAGLHLASRWRGRDSGVPTICGAKTPSRHSTWCVRRWATPAARSEDAGVICIGQAGERLVRFAAIMNDGKDGRATAVRAWAR